jgi:hypothetical protein
MTSAQEASADVLRDEANRLYQERVRYRDLNARAATLEGGALLIVFGALTHASDSAWNKIHDMRAWLIGLLVLLAAYSVFRVLFVRSRLKVVAQRTDDVRRLLHLPVLPGAGRLGDVWTTGACVVELAATAAVIRLILLSGPSAPATSFSWATLTIVGLVLNLIGTLMVTLGSGGLMQHVHNALFAHQTTIEALASPQPGVPVFTGLDERRDRALKRSGRVVAVGLWLVVLGFVAQVIAAIA